MLKVKCITDDFSNLTKGQKTPLVRKGEVYEVIDSGRDRWGEWYELSVQPNCVYPKGAFVPYKENWIKRLIKFFNPQ